MKNQKREYRSCKSCPHSQDPLPTPGAFRMTVRHCVPVPQAPEEWLHRNRSIEEHVGGTCEQMLKKRYQYASLVCDSFLRKNITRADVTARDIANYHNLTGKFSLSTSAMLIFFIQQLHQGRPGLDGIFQERWRKKKLTIPPGYTIELIDGARGLRYFFYVNRDSTGEDTFFSNMPGVVTV